MNLVSRKYKHKYSMGVLYHDSCLISKIFGNKYFCWGLLATFLEHVQMTMEALKNTRSYFFCQMYIPSGFLSQPSQVGETLLGQVVKVGHIDWMLATEFTRSLKLKRMLFLRKLRELLERWVKRPLNGGNVKVFLFFSISQKTGKRWLKRIFFLNCIYQLPYPVHYHLTEVTSACLAVLDKMCGMFY